jgi:hypothetical protein
MKTLLMACLCVASFASAAQNIGIGKSNPTEALDVQGNVNVDGKIKLNGSGGQPGQTLSVAADGTQYWANAFGYKNRQQLPTSPTWSTPTSWQVPPGVREVLIEAVGQGGGGAKGGGGGGAAYVIAKVKVAPGSFIGKTQVAPNQSNSPGFPATTETGTGMAGYSTLITGPGFSIEARGGKGAVQNAAGIGDIGVYSGDSIIYAQVFYGGMGQSMQETYSQRSATEFVTSRKQGDGGTCAFDPYNISRGGFFSFNSQTLFNITLILSPGTTTGFGAGGAGGNSTNGYWGGYGGPFIAYVSY